jgi:sulfide:quinone oxidoreductase
MTTAIEEPATHVSGSHRQFRVLIAGAGPAGIEAALTLQRLAGERVTVTIIAPEGSVHLPPAALEPFAAGRDVHPTLDMIARTHQRRGKLEGVDVTAREVRLDDGETLEYDALLVAVGAVQRLPLGRALAFGSPGSEERMHGLIQDLEGGYVKALAFVVPPDSSWPLPVYELALMTAERAFDMCVDVEVTLATHEQAPLGIFGPEVARDVERLLESVGIAIRTGVDVEMGFGGIELRPFGEHLNVDRIVTVPGLRGPMINGLPHDHAGFLPVDAHGRVLAAPGVYAAGDVTDFEIKQGGLACQQADAAAEAIAADAGVDIEPVPFVPILRGLLLTEHDTLRMQRELGGYGAAASADWPAAKFAGRELSRLLGGLDEAPR